MELENAQKMVLIDFNEYKRLVAVREESSTSVLSRQRREILDDKSLSDSDKILLYNKMCQRSKALETDKRREKYFESDRNEDSSHDKNIIFLEGSSSSKKNPIENVKRKLKFSPPHSSDSEFKTTPIKDDDGYERDEDDESLKRQKNLNRRKLIKSEKKRVSKQQSGGGIRSWSILN